MKYTVFQVNFCASQSDFDFVYQNLFKLASHAFRLIKKFYSIEIFPLINMIKQIILKGIKIFGEISLEFPNKFKHLTNLINLFESKKSKMKKGFTISDNHEMSNQNEKKHLSINSKGYAIKFAMRLISIWKKVKSKKDK
jgi:hypothetical protein